MVYWNLTNVTNSSSVLEFTQNVSTDILGGYMIGLFILLIVFSVFFFAIKSRGYYTSAAFSVACWLVTLCGLLLRPMGLIDDYTWFVSLILTPVAIFVLFIAGSKDV